MTTLPHRITPDWRAYFEPARVKHQEAMKSKYITFEPFAGLVVAVILPMPILHFQCVNPEGIKPRSAGFFTLQDGVVHVEAEGSTTLSLKPMSGDAEAIEFTLRTSGLLPAPMPEIPALQFVEVRPVEVGEL